MTLGTIGDLGDSGVGDCGGGEEGGLGDFAAGEPVAAFTNPLKELNMLDIAEPNGASGCGGVGVFGVEREAKDGALGAGTDGIDSDFTYGCGAAVPDDGGEADIFGFFSGLSETELLFRFLSLVASKKLRTSASFPPVLYTRLFFTQPTAL